MLFLEVKLFYGMRLKCNLQIYLFNDKYENVFFNIVLNIQL